MLVLTRFHGEKIMLGDDIEIAILGAKGPVRIGIKAPQEIKAWRKEIWDRIQAQKVKS